ncbi:MAG: tetratricopeptide repeat protein [Clostridiales bacterium]|jgi:tetratricopeptide (TPR) repeat protein|nr:tetratricopeptide repeat protein [Clostridiales bacterium]
MISAELQKMLDENRWDDGIAYISTLKEPLDDELLEKLGWCYSRATRYDDAKEIYYELIGRQPAQAKYHYLLGYQFYGQKDYKAAIEHYEKALEIFPDYFIVKYRLAYSYLQLAGVYMQYAKPEFWKAINHLDGCHKIFQTYSDDQAKENRSTYAKICFAHGKALLNSKNHADKTIALLAKAVELNADDYDYRYNLAQAYYNKGNFQMAMNTLKVLLKVERPKYYVLELNAQILTAQGKTSEAISALIAILRFRKKDYIFQRLAENYLIIGDNKNAENYAKQAITADNRNYKNFLICGEVYRAMAQFKTAISYFEQARQKRQNTFSVDCVEATRAIEEILAVTDNNPTDAILANSKEPSESTSVNSIRKSGLVIKYDGTRGFGFITEDKTNDRYFVHITQFPKGIIPEVGQIPLYVVHEAKGT